MSSTQIQVPAIPPQPQLPQGDPTTQLIIAIALLIKAIALLIHTLKRR
ncbi:hypothetical protein H6F51_08030 [Cyanobacteria bacterium FACHB-DQ100]|nr:hypothetical protein [Cyanobacteria bacterium FACHB-DQ100]